MSQQNFTQVATTFPMMRIVHLLSALGLALVGLIIGQQLLHAQPLAQPLSRNTPTVETSAPTAFGHTTFFTISAGTTDPDGSYKYNIDFGDNTLSTVITNQNASLTISHTYTVVDSYEVIVRVFSPSADPLFGYDVVTTTATVDQAIGLWIDDDFENLSNVNGWQYYQLEPNGVGGWAITNTAQHKGQNSLFHDDNFIGQEKNELPNQDSWAVSAEIEPTQDSVLTFWHMANYQLITGTHELYISTGSAEPKDNEFSLLKVLTHTLPNVWEDVELSLAPWRGERIHLAFRYRGTFADELYIDDVRVTGPMLVAGQSPTPLGEPTHLTATLNTGTNISYTWQFGDGTEGDGDVLTHTYPAVGVYTATISAENSVSKKTAQVAIIVQETISGLLASSDAPTIPGTKTTLDAQITSGSNITYYWDFGDGTATATTTEQTIDHIYDGTGLFTATVTATNLINTMTTSTSLIVEEAIGVMAVTSDAPTALRDPTVFSVTLSAGTTISYTWDFGDGTVREGHLRAPTRRVASNFVLTHTYAAIGTYQTAFTATNTLGTLSRTLTVDVDVPPGAPALQEDFDHDGDPVDWQLFTGGLNGVGWQVSNEVSRSHNNSFYHNDATGDQQSWLVSAPFVPQSNSDLRFWQFVKYAPHLATRTLHISVGSPDPKDGDYQLLRNFGRNEESTWEEIVIDLGQYDGQTAYLGFFYAGDFSDEWYLDDVVVTAPLFAVNDSETVWGHTTAFTATMQNGTRLTIDWDFGNGEHAPNMTTTHQYADPGYYTAVISISNSYGTVTATTPVSVLAKAYLPAVYSNFVHAPDLVVTELAGAGKQITVTIMNQGSAPVTSTFWVDAYINPTQAPVTVNDLWHKVGNDGLAWGVDDDALPLLPGQSMTLTVGDQYYQPEHSNFDGALLPGDRLYAQVDSSFTGNPIGGVNEQHEINTALPYNNVSGEFVVK